ncbi:MAG: hypothetical protein V3G42_15950 [Oscillospiraceae bacterium]
MKKINVNLYGGKPLFGGGREKPLEADIIYCDNCDNCSLYADGKCLRVRQAFGFERCKYGRCETIQGYTSRARKYNEFYSTYSKDEVYAKLKNAYGVCLARMGDYVYLNTTYANIEFLNDDVTVSKVTTSVFTSRGILLSKEQFTAENMLKILTARLSRLMDYSIIGEYNDRIVPEIMHEMERLFPEMYAELIRREPELGKPMSYIGKTVYTSTLVDGCTVRDKYGEFVFDKKAMTLTCEDYRDVPFTFRGKTCKMVIPVTEEMTYKVDDDSQCNMDTVIA